MPRAVAGRWHRCVTVPTGCRSREASLLSRTSAIGGALVGDGCHALPGRSRMRSGGRPMGWHYWTWDARASSASSPNGLPTICRPTGSPSGSSPHGTDATGRPVRLDRKSTRLNSSHTVISYAVFCLKKKKKEKKKDRDETTEHDEKL